jgi:sulfoxide reductase heme-binding subunit YedZ
VRRIISSKPAKGLIFLLALAPLAMLFWKAYTADLTANPIEYVTRNTGVWTLRFLLITLAITPLRRYLRLPELIRFRRMLGLFAFFYGFLHLTTYVWFDKFFEAAEISRDVVKRPFITAGFAGFFLMVPLALTSTSGWIRRLGGRRWQLLHRLVYLSALAGVVHYYWLVKSDIRLPLLYAALLLAAMLLRLPAWLGQRRDA